MSSSSSTTSHRGSMFVPRSNVGKWIMLLIVVWLVWAMVNHPTEAVDIIEGFFHAIGTLFTAIFNAYQESRNR